MPQLTNNSAAFGAPQGVTFDAAGDLWVIDGGTVATDGKVPPGLDEFTPAQLAALKTTPNPTPNVMIDSAGFVFPQQAVFDMAGNLWVSDNGSNAVFEFTPAQPMAGGANVAPNITISSTPKFNGPLGIAFDATGDLWIANNATTTIFEFNAGSLPKTSGAVVLTPNVVLSDDGKGSIQAPWALIFDTAGNLWSSNASNPPNTVVEFAKASLGVTGSPTPAVTISPATVAGDSSLIAPNGIAFDNLGDLAAANSATPFSISLFSKAQLGASGATVQAFSSRALRPPSMHPPVTSSGRSIDLTAWMTTSSSNSASPLHRRGDAVTPRRIKFLRHLRQPDLPSDPQLTWVLERNGTLYRARPNVPIIISATCFAVAKALAATEWSFMGRIYSSPMAS